MSAVHDPRSLTLASVPELQAARLLECIRATDADARAAAEWDADAQVSAVLRAARSEAHARVRQAAREKRERVAERCRKATAEAETRDRTSSFALDREFVARAVAALPGALALRWNDPAARGAWCAAAARLAAARLVSREWRVELDTGAGAAERAAIETCAAAAGARLAWASSSVPGLRIVAGGVAVDATVDGLLTDRAVVESLLLAALDVPAASTPAHGGAP
jgi:hypothetical protein